MTFGGRAAAAARLMALVVTAVSVVAAETHPAYAPSPIPSLPSLLIPPILPSVPTASSMVPLPSPAYDGNRED
ncbi:hypothetical protein GCM10009548_81260 [Streptomyces malaysiensis subsp. malaysiensis]